MDCSCHVSQFELGILKGANGLPKLMPIVYILQSCICAELSATNATTGYIDSPAVDCRYTVYVVNKTGVNVTSHLCYCVSYTISQGNLLSPSPWGLQARLGMPHTTCSTRLLVQHQCVMVCVAYKVFCCMTLTCIHSDVEAFAQLPKQICSRHSDIVHHDCACGLCIPAQFVLCFAKAQP